MRELKFRAWSKKHNRYLKITGVKYDGDKFAGVFVVYRTIGGIPDIIFLEPKDVILEQYTELKDKNGKEIYEGDVVKYTYRKDYIGQVAFGFVNDSEGYYIEKHYGWGIYSDGSDFSLGDYADDDMRCELVEVIGNIHENHELLEEEQ